MFKMFDKNRKAATMVKKHNKGLTDKVISCNMIKNLTFFSEVL